MNLEKLGLILFIKYLRQFEGVKKHLLASLRELLMAMSSTLSISNQITSDNFILGRIHTLETTFRKIDSALNYSIKQLETKPSPATEPNNHLKDNIVESIVSVINEEIEKIAESSSINKDLKIEALDTVKKVLNNHLNGNDEPYFDDIIEVEQASGN